jgi:hypothetical protein
MENHILPDKNLTIALMDGRLSAGQPPICTIDREGFRNPGSPMGWWASFR